VENICNEFKEEEILIQLKKFKSDALSLNAGINKIKAEISEKVKDLGLQSLELKQLSNLLLKE